MGQHIPTSETGDPTTAHLTTLLDALFVQLFNQVSGVQIDADDGDGPRSNYDAEAKGFVWYDSTINTWYQKKSATSADWSNGVNFTAGILQNIVEDTSPELGGNFDLGSYELSGSGRLLLTSAVAAYEPIALSSTDPGAAVGPILPVARRSASPAVGDLLGQIRFIGRDDSGSDLQYGTITQQIVDPSNGSEDGQLNFDLMVAGALSRILDLNAAGIQLLGANARVDKILDEDNMASDDAAALATQQSIKAYADTKAQVKAGTYTGDGSESQAITGVGFQPIFVMISERATGDATAVGNYFTTSVIVDDNGDGGTIQDSGSALRFRLNHITALGSDGFTVDDFAADAHPNKNGTTYNYFAIG